MLRDQSGGSFWHFNTVLGVRFAFLGSFVVFPFLVNPFLKQKFQIIREKLLLFFLLMM